MERVEGLVRPVPAPRRIASDTLRTDYENVNLESGNLNTVDHDANKLPANSKFYVNLCPDQSNTNNDKNNGNGSDKNDEGQAHFEDVYGPHANENVVIEPVITVNQIENLYATPMPLPRLRKPKANAAQTTYENTIVNDNEIDIDNSSNESVRIVRAAPVLPPKKHLYADHVLRHSIANDVATVSSSDTVLQNATTQLKSATSMATISVQPTNADSEEIAAGKDAAAKYKSASPSFAMSSNVGQTLNADDSTEQTGQTEQTIANEQENADDLFKTLGTTSKLLTESIGERVASKAKGAKQILDKNFKTSTELISNLGAETSTRLKTAGKRFGSNFTLGRKERSSEAIRMPGIAAAAAATAIAEFDCERPQTLPAANNHQVFDTIKFSSPLNHNMTGGIMDLSAVQNDDLVSYEVPNISRVCTANSSKKLEAATTRTTAAEIAAMPKLIAAKTALHKQSDENISEMDALNDALISLPMPNYPPPALPKDFAQNDNADNDDDNDCLYGKLNKCGGGGAGDAVDLCKRDGNYEQIHLRRAALLKGNSDSNCQRLRPKLNSMELQQLNLAIAAAEREKSIIIREKIKAAEAKTPKPERSESWEFYADDNDGDDDYNKDDEDVEGESIIEPLYANHESTYGKLANMAINNVKNIEQNELISIKSMHQNNANHTEISGNCSVEGAVGGCILRRPTNDIIQEFDPLSKQMTAAKATAVATAAAAAAAATTTTTAAATITSTSIFNTNKSNELLLLENLIEEDTYGNLHQLNADDDIISTCTSDEDNLSVTAASASATATATAVDGTTIVEQKTIMANNSKPFSISISNLETQVKPYLSRVEEMTRNNDVDVDLSRPSDKRTQWFCSEPTRLELEECPPPYLEVIDSMDGKSNAFNHELKQLSNSNSNNDNNNNNNNNNNNSVSLSSRLNPKSMFTNVKVRMDALRRKTSFRNANAKSADVKVALQMIPRPSLSTMLVRYEGPLIRFPTGVVEDILKEMQNRKATLRERQFQTFLDQDMKTLKETIPLEHITTLQCTRNNRVTDNATHFYCFELTTYTAKNGYGLSSFSGSANNLQMLSNNQNLVLTSGTTGNIKRQRVTHVYGVSKESERAVWMQKLLESLTNMLPMKYTCHYYRAGWCYLKTSVTAQWSGAWLVLRKSQRRLIFVTEVSGNVEKMDLRKARSIVLKEKDDSIANLHVEAGPLLTIDCPPFTVYVIMSSPRETKNWALTIREIAHNNGLGLSDQQLTKYNCPVIVDKCISFVFIYGSLSEGIYRKSGSENSILRLMTAFRSNAFNVVISREIYSEHDVANVLKRFMRDLPVRLLGKLTNSFISVPATPLALDKIAIYKELITRLNVVERETLKRIVRHLDFISSQESKNKMSVTNLTKIWGPTLLGDYPANDIDDSQKSAMVLTELIAFNKNLFPMTAEEIQREEHMLMCLKKFYAAQSLQNEEKKSGDLKIWIQISQMDSNKVTEDTPQVNVTVKPTKTAYEICSELAPKLNLPTHQVILYEIIMNGSLCRPLHHDTKVFDVILNWSYWPEADCKNNYLMVRPIDFLRDVHRAIKNLPTMTPCKELKFVDNRTKSFKTLQCEFRDGKIVISKKDKNEKTTIIREIFLHNATIYLGCERKRDFPFSWCLTFIERTQTKIMRSRDAPYIGHVLAGSEWVDRTIWYASIWYYLYGENILPPAEIILK